MANKKSIPLDVAVIGGGPAGISACLELSKSVRLKVALFESEVELGGIPRSSHIFFGLRDRKRIYTGPAYARRLDRLIRKTSVEVHTGATVLNIIPGNPGEAHRFNVVSPYGLESYESRFLILATGCFENSRQARGIAGTRPAGIFTTGTLQELVNVRHLKPGKRAVIIGSEHVALSCVLTLRRAGVSIIGIVEEYNELQTYIFPLHVMKSLLGFPIYRDTSVKAILGNNRVEGIELLRGKDQKILRVPCDTIIITGRFRPNSSLIENTPIEQDISTLGPLVDMNFRTTIPNIYAIGNLLRGADMHDLCALEGRLAARDIIGVLKSGKADTVQCVPIRVKPPIRYIVPQRIAPTQIRRRLFSKLFPWPSIQVERTLINPVIEAWSGKMKIWEASFRRLIANNRYPLPVERFEWQHVDFRKGITLKAMCVDP
jgi:NADPH-dependent 2,4-dienoyl-CoA reductase/sulfur reductase-like enzyme